MPPREGGAGKRDFPAPRKRFGQHFLTDPRILARIADAARISDGDTVIEIGPGRGALTAPLAARIGPSGTLVACELDRDLAAALREAYAGDPRVSVVEGDYLEADLTTWRAKPHLLAGNIPYNITTPIVFHALERPRAERMVFLVQREVAERLGAAPGSDDYGALSINVQAVASVEIVFRVPAGAFSPPPKVESAVVRITPRADPIVTPAEEVPYRELVQGLFSFRRKQVVRALREWGGFDAATAEGIVERAGITPTARPEVLSPDDFVKLLRALPRGTGAS